MPSATSPTQSSIIAALLLVGCSAPPITDTPSRIFRTVSLQPSWLTGSAEVFRSLQGPVFGVSVRLRATDLRTTVLALGSNSPCFRVALVERCGNGAEASAIPRIFSTSPPADAAGVIPIWCPAIDTSFEWSAEFTDYRTVLGYPGTFQPLMRCRGPAEVAVHLFPSGLRSSTTVLPRPGIPLSGLPITQWLPL